MSHRLEIAKTLAALSTTALIGLACSKVPVAATEVPGTSSAPGPAAGEASCSHAEGKCGGHTEGDGACGAAKADAADKDAGAAAMASADAFEHSWSVAPGKFAEINLVLADKASVVATYTIEGGQMSWNVHSHVDDKAVIHHEGSDAKGEVEFVAPGDGIYSYMWTNKGDAEVKISVKLSARGQVKLHSTHPAAGS